MNSKIKTLLIFLNLLLIAILFYGCGTDEGMVIAKIGSDKIYANNLNEIFKRSQNRYSSFDDEFASRKDITDSLVIQQLLIQEAYRKNIDDVEEVARIVLANRDGFIMDVLYQTQILDKINVSEDEIKDFYIKLEYKVRASHILVDNKDSSLMILDSLKNGGNFENLAIGYSLDPQAKTTRGDLGYFLWGQMDQAFQEQAFKLDPGQMSEPFETRFGWHIVKVVDRTPNELRGEYGEMADQIRRSREGMQNRKFMEAYRDELTEKYPIRIDTITCEYLINKRESLYPPSILKSLPKNDFDIAQLDRHEQELVFASWDGGQMSLGQYLSLIKRINSDQKPDLDDYDNLSKFIFLLKYQDILLIQARKIGIEDTPLYKQKINRFKEITMADIMENDSIPLPPLPDEGELKQYYEDNQVEFLVPPKAHIYEILFNDLQTAETNSKKIGSLNHFKSMATQYTERSAKRASGGDMGWIDSRSYPKYFRAAEKNEIGSVCGPIQTGTKYALIFIADIKEETTKDFPMVRQGIYNKIEENRKRKAFEDWVKEFKAKTDIKIYENNIRATINKALYRKNTPNSN